MSIDWTEEKKDQLRQGLKKICAGFLCRASASRLHGEIRAAKQQLSRNRREGVRQHQAVMWACMIRENREELARRQAA